MGGLPPVPAESVGRFLWLWTYAHGCKSCNGSFTGPGLRKARFRVKITARVLPSCIMGAPQ